jgi:hypothetical protein
MPRLLPRRRLGERPTGQSSGRQPGSAREETAVSHKEPRITEGKRKANELASSDSVGSMELATRRPAPRPQSRALSAPLPVEAKRISAQVSMVKSTASTGEQAAPTGRQFNYAEVSAAYAGVMAGRPVTGANPGVDSSAQFPTKNWASQDGGVGGGEGREGVPRNSSRVHVPQREEGRCGRHHYWRTLKRSTRRAKDAKWDAQAHSHEHWHCVGTSCFEGSSSKADLFRGSRRRVLASQRHTQWHHFSHRPSG